MSEENALQIDTKTLPPFIQKFIRSLEDDRKKLMKDKNFEKPEHLRAFVGTYLIPRMIEITKMHAMAELDVYELGVSNTNEMRRLRKFVIDELNELGAHIDDDAPLPGISAEVIDDLQQAFYALGGLLHEKLPGDKQMEEAFNRCAELLAEATDELLGVEREEEKDDEEPGEDAPEPEAEEEGEPEAKPEETPEAPEPGE
jgi:hypothetical protein